MNAIEKAMKLCKTTSFTPAEWERAYSLWKNKAEKLKFLKKRYVLSLDRNVDDLKGQMREMVSQYQANLPEYRDTYTVAEVSDILADLREQSDLCDEYDLRPLDPNRDLYQMISEWRSKLNALKAHSVSVNERYVSIADRDKCTALLTLYRTWINDEMPVTLNGVRTSKAFSKFLTLDPQFVKLLDGSGRRTWLYVKYNFEDFFRHFDGKTAMKLATDDVSFIVTTTKLDKPLLMAYGDGSLAHLMSCNMDVCRDIRLMFETEIRKYFGFKDSRWRFNTLDDIVYNVSGDFCRVYNVDAGRNLIVIGRND